MKANKNVKEQRKNLSKNKFHIDKQEDNKIISEAELKDKHGVTGNKTYYFLFYLTAYYTGNLHELESNSLVAVAKLIYQENKLFFKVEGGYKRMKFSSIKDNLYQLSVQVMEELTEFKHMK